MRRGVVPLVPCHQPSEGELVPAQRRSADRKSAAIAAVHRRACSGEKAMAVSPGESSTNGRSGAERDIAGGGQGLENEHAGEQRDKR